jgi:hypothetical protein
MRAYIILLFTVLSNGWHDYTCDVMATQQRGKHTTWPGGACKPVKQCTPAKNNAASSQYAPPFSIQALPHILARQRNSASRRRWPAAAAAALLLLLCCSAAAAGISRCTWPPHTPTTWLRWLLLLLWLLLLRLLITFLLLLLLCQVLLLLLLCRPKHALMDAAEQLRSKI